MTFNYDEEDDFDETDDFDESNADKETDNLNNEPEDDSLEEVDEPNTALSLAFREATTSETEDEEETPEDDDADESADEQRLVETIDTLPDNDGTGEDTEEDATEEDSDIDDDALEIELPPLELLPSREVVEHFRPQEQSNTAYADAMTAYYEEKDYQRAVEKFDEAITYEGQRTEGSPTVPNEIVAKSKYWQAEAYAKLQNLSQAIEIFEDLIRTCQGHYLVLAAQRRADQLNMVNV